MDLSNIGIRNQEGAMFGDLPLDLHLHIFNFTDLGDIIALRKVTCKRFHSITSQRILWVYLLRRICSDNSVFKPTFPIDEMSLMDLEQAVFAPTLNQVMNNNYDDIISSRRMRTITPSTNPCFQKVYLVPGGRFLVTFSNVDMCVWDLGYSSSAVLKNTPIAVAPHTFYDSFSVVPTADELGLRIFADADQETDGWTDEERKQDELWIFEIYPLSDKPALSKIASLPVEDYSKVEQVLLRGDLLVYHGENYVKVWNFVTDMGVSFNVGDDMFEQVYVTGDSIILFRAAMVSIWNIPPLIPGGHTEEPGEQFVKPSLEIFVDWNVDVDTFEEGKELGVQLERPNQWYTHHPIAYDRIYQYKEFCAISRYEVVLPEGHVKLQNKFILPKELLATDFEPYRICNRNLVMYWTNYRSVVAASVPYERQKMDNFWESEDITLLEDDEILGLGFKEFTLCPVVGRLCHVSSKQDSIIIFDYLTPPSS